MFFEIKMGRIRAISISKIRKIIEIKKKLIENGIRDEHIASKPHSNDDLFSRSIESFLLIK